MKKEKGSVGSGSYSSIISTLLFSFGPLLITFSGLNAYSQLFISRAMSVLFLILFVLFYRLYNHAIELKSLNKISFNHLVRTGINRILIGATFTYSMCYGPEVENLVISQCWPAVLFLIDKKSIKKYSNIVCLSLGFLGSLFVVVGSKNLNDLTPFHYTYLVSLLHSCLLAQYFNIVKNIPEQSSTNEIFPHSISILYQEFIGFLLILILLPFFSLNINATSNEISLMLLYGVFAHAIPRVLINFASENMDTIDFSLHRYLTPMIATSYLIYFHNSQGIKPLIIGGSLCLVAIVLRKLSSIRNNNVVKIN